MNKKKYAFAKVMTQELLSGVVQMGNHKDERSEENFSRQSLYVYCMEFSWLVDVLLRINNCGLFNTKSCYI